MGVAMVVAAGGCRPAIPPKPHAGDFPMRITSSIKAGGILVSD
jgi:hypothetical protein